MIRRVEITRRAEKQLRKLPRHIVDNLTIWVAAVELDGLKEVRRIPGYHD
jgi:proteic killer suppression protein